MTNEHIGAMWSAIVFLGLMIGIVFSITVEFKSDVESIQGEVEWAEKRIVRNTVLDEGRGRISAIDAIDLILEELNLEIRHMDLPDRHTMELRRISE